jgi:hypothetical protein
MKQKASFESEISICKEQSASQIKLLEGQVSELKKQVYT